MARWRNDIRCRSPTAAAACDGHWNARTPAGGGCGVDLRREGEGVQLRHDHGGCAIGVSPPPRPGSTTVLSRAPPVTVVGSGGGDRRHGRRAIPDPQRSQLEHQRDGKRTKRRSGRLMTGVDDGGVESTSRGGCGGWMEAAPRWGNVDGVTRERLHEGRRLWTMGGGVGGRRIRPRWAGMEILWLPLLSSLRLASVGLHGRNHMAGKKRFFLPKVGKIPGEAGKNSTRKSGTIVLGTVAPTYSYLCI